MNIIVAEALDYKVAIKNHWLEIAIPSHVSGVGFTYTLHSKEFLKRIQTPSAGVSMSEPEDEKKLCRLMDAISEVRVAAHSHGCRACSVLQSAEQVVSGVSLTAFRSMVDLLWQLNNHVEARLNALDCPTCREQLLALGPTLKAVANSINNYNYLGGRG